MTTRDLAVYPADEQLMHNLYSANCKCKPTVEVIGATLLYAHNSLYETIKAEEERCDERRTTKFTHLN